MNFVLYELYKLKKNDYSIQSRNAIWQASAFF